MRAQVEEITGRDGNERLRTERPEVIVLEVWLHLNNKEITQRLEQSR